MMEEEREGGCPEIESGWAKGSTMWFQRLETNPDPLDWIRNRLSEASRSTRATLASRQGPERVAG